MTSKALIWTAALTAAIALGGAAQATIIPIDDTFYSGGVGKASGPDAMGNTWSWGTTKGPPSADSPGKGFSAWGTPGINVSPFAVYTNPIDAIDFEIAFTYNYLKGVGIDTTPSTGMTSQWTQFWACNSKGKKCVEWAADYTADSAPHHEVDFYAPAGDKLVSGDEFFVDVVFQTKKFGMSDTTPYASFSASFSQAVPEASTWAMLGIGFAGIGLVGLSKRRNGSRYAAL